MIRIFICFAALLVCFTNTPESAQAKTVLVTGSNRGIGLEFIAQYAADGWDVIATSRSPGDDEDLKALAASHANITIEQLDVANLDHIAALAKKYDGTAIDVLINNAGMIGDHPRQAWGNLDKDLFDQIMAVNVFGPLKISESFTPHIAASEEKKIIVISSASGSIASVRNPPGTPYYSISKAAVNMAMRGTAMRLKDQGITVGIFMPGGVDTRMLRQAIGMSKAEAEAAEDFDYRGFTPLTAEQSVSQMRTIFDRLTLARSGDFLNYDGAEIPW
jgi:NAD(P)-dependent dehydrogenase (short-subunit alcohol dehydrogenase family)